VAEGRHKRQENGFLSFSVPRFFLSLMTVRDTADIKISFCGRERRPGHFPNAIKWMTGPNILIVANIKMKKRASHSHLMSQFILMLGQNKEVERDDCAALNSPFAC